MTSELSDALADAISDPGRITPEERRRSLINAYFDGGSRRADVVRERCLKVITGPNPLGEKLVAIRILDLLMELEDSSLAVKLADRDLQLFSGLAQKSFPSGMFNKKATSSEKKQVADAIVELLDKWGQRYSNEARGANLLHLWTEERELVRRLGVQMPKNSKQYRIVSEHYLPMEAPQQSSTGQGKSEGGLDPAELSRLSKDFETSFAQHGPGSEQFAMARAHFESVLNKWQDAAQQAAENDNFEEFERIHSTYAPYNEKLNNIDAGDIPSVSPSPPRASPQPSSSMGFDPPEPSRSSRPKKEKKEKRGERGGGGGGGFDDDAFAPADWDQGAFGGDFATSGFGGDFPSNPFDTTSATGAQDWGAVDPAQDWGAADWGANAPTQDWGSAYAHAMGGEDERYLQELEQQAEELRQEIASYSNLEPSPEEERQLQNAQYRMRELEPLKYELKELREQIDTKNDVNAQLQREIDCCRRDIYAARVKANKILESGSSVVQLLAGVNKRLAREEDWVDTLKDEIKEKTQMHEFLTGNLSQFDVKSETLQHEISYIKKAFKDAHVAYVGSGVQKGNVSYSQNGDGRSHLLKTGELADGVTVQQSDELAYTKTAYNQSGPTERGITQIAEEASKALLFRSSQELWYRTQRLSGAPGALVVRLPRSRREYTLATQANFRHLLLQDKGPLCADPELGMQMELRLDRSKKVPRFDFEIAIVNRCGHPIQEVDLVSKEAAYIRGVEFRLESCGEPGQRTLWPHEALRFKGYLKVLTAFQMGPLVELSYLLPDDMHSRSRLRLPLSIVRLLTPLRLEPFQFVELWESELFIREEVALVFPVRRCLMDPRSPLSCAKCAVLGGALCILHGIGESHTNIVLATSFPQRKAPSEILVHLELGGPDGRGGPWCRLAVRAGTNGAGRAVAQALLDVLGEVLDPAGPGYESRMQNKSRA